LRRDRVETGARLVHDTLEREGWDVEIGDAQKVKGLAPLACKTDKIDSKVLATLSHRDLVPAIWLPDPRVREERELARFRLHLVLGATGRRLHSARRAGASVPQADSTSALSSPTSALVTAIGSAAIARCCAPEISATGQPRRRASAALSS
jgi:hypothetical protein